jgi:hypothetical protein
MRIFPRSDFMVRVTPSMKASPHTEAREVQLHSPDVMREIAEKAYALWQQRGCPHGNYQEDWFKAEVTVLRQKVPWE